MECTITLLTWEGQAYLSSAGWRTVRAEQPRAVLTRRWPWGIRIPGTSGDVVSLSMLRSHLEFPGQFTWKKAEDLQNMIPEY